MSDPKGIQLRLNETLNNFEIGRKTNFNLDTLEINRIFKSDNLNNKKLTQREIEVSNEFEAKREALRIERQELKLEREEIKKEKKRMREMLSAEKEKWFQQLHRGDFTRDPEEDKIEVGLNKKGCQLDSKTEKALRSIAKMHHLSKIKYPNKKLVTIVFTNNSLLEGAQWQNRTAMKFEGTDIKCQRLASDSIEKEKDFSRANQLLAAFSAFSGLDGESHLGDILIMCNHPTRIKDIQKLVEICAGNGVSERGRHEFRFNVFFDEFDKPRLRSQMFKLFNFIHKKKLAYMINHIQLISATTPSEILREMTKIFPEAVKMINIQKQYKEEDDMVGNYRTILSQEFIPHEGDLNPVEYVKSIKDNKPDIFVPNKIHFIPSRYRVSSHEEMARQKIFLENGYWILIINGQNKEFRSPLGDIEKINLKKKYENGKTKQLYEILTEWRKEHPKSGLVITGNECIERGATFLTNGFKFDYMIISGYFKKDIFKLIQIGGRGQGKTQYVDNFKLIMPQALYDKMEKFIIDDEKLTNAEHDFYDEDLLDSVGKEEPKSLNKNDIAFEAFEGENAENNALARINKILDGIKKLPDWEYREKTFKPSFTHIKNKKVNDVFIKENGFFKERCLGHGNKGKYKVYSLEEMRNTRGEHDSGQATKTYKTHICYENVENASTIRYVICYPKSHLEKIKSPPSVLDQFAQNGVVESKNGD